MSVDGLPLLNASINTAVAILLVVGYVLIRRRRRDLHKWVMLCALVLSALFLSSYLTYHFLRGSTKFTGEGAVRPLYFALLISHTTLAVVNLPFIVVTVWRAFKGQFAAHRRVAVRTWVVWLYVAVTGPLVYLMLYQLYPASKVFARAQALHRQDKEQEALALYERAAGGGHRPSRCYAAVLGDRLHETSTATATLEHALTEDPGDLHCQVLYARELVYRDQMDRALPILKRVVKQDPREPFFWASLGFAEFRKMSYREAAAAFEKSVALDPTQPANFYNAGYAHYLYGDYPHAKPLIEKALSMQLAPEIKQRAEEDLAVINGSLWICPMHSEVVGKSGEKCSICGMELAPASHGLTDDQ
jgi:putative membrane protein